MNAEFFSLCLDVVSARGEAVERLPVDALAIRPENLEGAVFPGQLCLVAQALELFAKDRVGHRAKRSAGSVHRPVMPGSPAVIAGDLSGLWIDAIGVAKAFGQPGQIGDQDRKSTRLNSSH